MKKIILLVLIFGIGGVARAADEAASVPVQIDAVGVVDLAKFFGNVRTGYLLGQEKLLSAYVPLISYKGRTGAEYVNLDFGAGYNSETRKGKPILITGLRVDSFLAKIGTLSPRIQTAKFPALEIGPTMMIDFSEPKPLENLKFMFSIAYKIGG